MGKSDKCKSILIVEDDQDIRESLVETLMYEGYHVAAAANGKEALNVLTTSQKPCLVLLDMMMPIMDGRQFLDKVMSDNYLAPIPIVIVSAVADKVSTEGAVGFIKKPLDIDVIINMVEKYC